MLQWHCAVLPSHGGMHGCVQPQLCNMLHLLTFVHDCCCRGLGAWANFAHTKTNLPTPEVDSFVKAAIFSTLTNVSWPHIANLDWTLFHKQPDTLQSLQVPSMNICKYRQ